MISEDVLNDLEAIKNDLYPKQSYEGSWITVENTIEGLRAGKVTADEDTTIVVNNKNLWASSKINQTTKYGVTCTYNDEDDSVTLNGTCTKDNIYFALGMNPAQTIKNSTTLSAYYVSGSVDFDETVAVARTSAYISTRAYFPNYNGGIILDISTLTEDNPVIYGTVSNSLAGTEKLTIFDIRVDAGTVLDNFTFKIMLTETIDTDFVKHQEQNYSGTEAEIKTYEDITHIYNADDINMSAEIRVKEEN